MSNNDNKFEFCSVLRDHPDVEKQARLYPYIDIKYDKSKIPDTFDGRFLWSMYIEPPSKQRDSSSWGLVAKDILNDRYCLSTAGQLYFFLDYTEMVACLDKHPLKKLDNVPSTNSLSSVKNITQGYNIYDAWEYIYSYGLSNWNCVSREDMIDNGITPPDKMTYEKSQDYYKDYCKKTLYECVRQKEGKPVARRSFFSDSIFNIEGRDMKERIMNIKYEIAKWGPVAGGFLVYENFMNIYKGLDVYNKAEGKVLGGHYVSIVGWGKDYWICRNSFGADWGLMGYFYMKMGLEECKLEYNISAVGPSVLNNLKYETRSIIPPDAMTYNKRQIYVNQMDLFNPKIYKIREEQKVNYYLFYTQQTIDLIKEKKLYGDLKPLIAYPDLLPDMNFYWVKDMTKYDFVDVSGKVFYDDANYKSHNISRYVEYGILIGILFFIIGFVINIKYKR